MGRVRYGIGNMFTRGGRRTEQILIDKQYAGWAAGEIIEASVRAINPVAGAALDADRFIKGYNEKRMNTAFPK